MSTQRKTHKLRTGITSRLPVAKCSPKRVELNASRRWRDVTCFACKRLERKK